MTSEWKLLYKTFKYYSRTIQFHRYQFSHLWSRLYLLEHLKQWDCYKKNFKYGWLLTFRETMRTQIASALGTQPYNLMVEQMPSSTAASEGCMQATVFFIGMVLNSKWSRYCQYTCKSLTPTPPPPNPRESKSAWIKKILKKALYYSDKDCNNMYTSI